MLKAILTTSAFALAVQALPALVSAAHVPALLDESELGTASHEIQAFRASVTADSEEFSMTDFISLEEQLARQENPELAQKKFDGNFYHF